MTRDLTKEQFKAKLAKRGMKLELLGEYVDIGGTLVARWNGGDKRRSQLAYLIAEQKRHREMADKKRAGQ